MIIYQHVTYLYIIYNSLFSFTIINHLHSLKLTAKAPKNGWLEYYFPIGEAATLLDFPTIGNPHTEASFQKGTARTAPEKLLKKCPGWLFGSQTGEVVSLVVLVSWHILGVMKWWIFHEWIYTPIFCV